MESIGRITSQGGTTALSHYMAEEILREFKEGDLVSIEIKKLTPSKARSIPQNSSIHLYCGKLSDAFNNGGFDMKVVFDKMIKSFFISWSMILVKQVMWHKIQYALFDIESTTKLTTDQVTVVYEHINRFTAENFGISIQFPSQESLMYESINEQKQGDS